MGAQIMRSIQYLIIACIVLITSNLFAQTETELIAETLMDYIKGTANGEPDRVANAFHPDLNLYTVANDSLSIRTSEEYIANIIKGDKLNRSGRIVSIDYENNAATSKVVIEMPDIDRIYTDFLLLLKYEGKWKIIQKSYTFVDTNKDEINDKKINKPGENNMSELKPKVTGIGGIFFKSKNPKESKEWYGKNLGLAIGEYGSPFEFRNANRPEEINYLNWSPFSENTDYFAPSEKEFMINYRVQNIVGLVEQLKANGVTVVDEIESYDYGKFVHIMDPEGNKIELWEPIDSVFTAMGGETTK